MTTLAELAGFFADPTRVRILLALIERDMTVSELVELLGAPQPRVSTHLRVLAGAGLVCSRRDGRQRIYAAVAPRVEPMLTGLQFAVGGDDVAPDRAAHEHVARDTPLRRARRCYDHIAGSAAVALLDVLLERGWLNAASWTADRIDFTLPARGERGLTAHGIDIPAARAERRLFAFGCPDWTEPRPHLGGSLGHAITAALERDGMITRRSRHREVNLLAPLTDWLDAPS